MNFLAQLHILFRPLLLAGVGLLLLLRELAVNRMLDIIIQRDSRFVICQLYCDFVLVFMLHKKLSCYQLRLRLFNDVFVVGVRVELHLIRISPFHSIQKLPLVLLRPEPLMHDFESVTDGVVFPLQSSEARQDLVINPLDQHHFFKRVVVLHLPLLFLVPSLDAVLDCGLLQADCVHIVRRIFDDLIDFCPFFINISLLLKLLNLLGVSVFVHQVGKELGAEAHHVLRLLGLLPVLPLFLEKYCEARVAVEPFRAEVGEVAAIDDLIISVLNVNLLEALCFDLSV